MTSLNGLVLCCAIAAAQFAGVLSIGERMLDLNGLFGMIRGFSDIFDDVNTTDVDTHKMMGKWHQMYRAAINFDVFRTNLYCQVAYFEPNLIMGPDGFKIEEAYHVVSKFGDIETYRKDASKTGPGQYWIHPHEYFYPHQFYIMKAGPEVNETYQYIVASDGNKLALTVLARNPQEFYAKYDAEVLDFLAENRIGGDVFWNQPNPIYQGPDCYYPSQRDIFARRILSAQLKKKGSSGGGSGTLGGPAASLGGLTQGLTRGFLGGPVPGGVGGGGAVGRAGGPNPNTGFDGNRISRRQQHPPQLQYPQAQGRSLAFNGRGGVPVPLQGQARPQLGGINPSGLLSLFPKLLGGQGLAGLGGQGLAGR